LEVDFLKQSAWCTLGQMPGLSGQIARIEQRPNPWLRQRVDALEDSMADEATLKSLRKLEAELDEHHRTLPFHSVSTGTALYALLSMFDSILAIEPALAPDGPEDVRTMQFKSSLEEGLSQALRWKIGRDVSVDPVPTTDKDFMELAGDYIMYGGDYSNLVAFHVMLNKGWAEVEVDIERKTVRFLPSPDHEVRRVAGVWVPLGSVLRTRAVGRSASEIRARQPSFVGDYGPKFKPGEAFADGRALR
jgi:hypothetical protein